MAREAAPVSQLSGITFHHPWAFWIGTVAITAGVLMHLPDYVASAPMNYRMAGMEMGWLMNAGMGLILAGMVLAAYGLIPLGRAARDARPRHIHGIRIHAMDSAPLSGAHWGLLVVLGVALVADVMKPATLGFVAPGMKSEYGLTTSQVAALPLVALTGTTLGSFMWGMLSDRIGRRAAILLAALIFIGTAICGFMPSYAWNLFMCFVMGLSAGGMLPIVYALMAESVPAKKRGWLVVLHAGLGSVGGYLAASGLAALLEPHFAWRILWLPGLPTGLLLLILNRWIPESPRFLLEHGRVDEAEAVMARYGVVVERTDPAAPRIPTPIPVAAVAAEAPTAPRQRPGLGRLFKQPFLPQTLTVLSYGLGWGLVNWGFITFIPAILQDRGVETASASKMLFVSSLLAVPGTLLVAYLYGNWSSKKSMILFALVTVAALIGFAIVDPGAAGEQGRWLMPLMVLLLVGTGGVISMLSPYTAEVYPTGLRGTGSGLAAGSSKMGGIFGPPLVAGVAALAPGFGVLALLAAAPIAISAVVLSIAGVETRNRSLEDVIAEHATAA